MFWKGKNTKEENELITELEKQFRRNRRKNEKK